MLGADHLQWVDQGCSHEKKYKPTLIYSCFICACFYQRQSYDGLLDTLSTLHGFNMWMRTPNGKLGYPEESVPFRLNNKYPCLNLLCFCFCCCVFWFVLDFLICVLLFMGHSRLSDKQNLKKVGHIDQLQEETCMKETYLLFLICLLQRSPGQNDVLRHWYV